MVTRRKLLSCAAAASLTAGEVAFGMCTINPANANESADLELLILADRHEQLWNAGNKKGISENEVAAKVDEAARIAQKVAKITAKTAIGVVAKLTIGVAPDELKSLLDSEYVYERVEGLAVLDARNVLFGGKAVRS